MIALENLSKSFMVRGRRHVVVDHLNVTLPTGRSVGFLGRNGAGKSTLLEIIAGSLRPDTGRVVSTGAISWTVGFSGSFHPELTGAQNVRFIARIYGVDTDELVRYVEAFAEIGDHFHMPVRGYSSGMRARLAFGTSMGIKFDTYLIDEVTAVGDVSFRTKSHAVLRDRLKTSGAIMVSHSMHQLREICQSGLVLEGGKATFFDNLEDAIEQHHENMLRRGGAGSRRAAE